MSADLGESGSGDVTSVCCGAVDFFVSADHVGFNNSSWCDKTDGLFPTFKALATASKTRKGKAKPTLLMVRGSPYSAPPVRENPHGNPPRIETSSSVSILFDQEWLIPTVVYVVGVRKYTPPYEGPFLSSPAGCPREFGPEPAVSWCRGPVHAFKIRRADEGSLGAGGERRKFGSGSQESRPDTDVGQGMEQTRPGMHCDQPDY
ncbi:hypothetical protein Bbelb_136340 [Branchiostoma belcheri]|nr:hypothetical protein Bbelb_136340 [Branchiostoma belcheri]